MPKLRKDDVADIDVREMEEAEWSDEDFSSYDGEVPPTGTILTGYIKKMWWTRTSNDDPMIKVLWVADENAGDKEEFNNLPVWENAALIPSAKFKWAPLLDNFGLTIRDIVNKTIVAAEDDNVGAPIEKIGTFMPGTDEAWSRVVINRRRYNGEWQANVKKWLPYEVDEDEEEGETEPEDPFDEDEEAEEPEDEETEEEEPEETPTRGRGRTTSRSTTGGNGRTARAASKPATRKTQASTPARAKKPAAAAAETRRGSAARKPKAGTRGKQARDEAFEEPPF